MKFVVPKLRSIGAKMAIFNEDQGNLNGGADMPFCIPSASPDSFPSGKEKVKRSEENFIFYLRWTELENFP